MKFSGEGTITYDNGDVYKGASRDSAPHGAGKMTYKDERVCEGIWRNGKIEYEGDMVFVFGKPHGRGKKIYSNGYVYEGEWKYGLRHGKGLYKRSDGSVIYDGEWKDDKKHGKGIIKLKYADGSVIYDGEWKDDKKNGMGTFKWRDISDAHLIY